MSGSRGTPRSPSARSASPESAAAAGRPERTYRERLDRFRADKREVEERTARVGRLRMAAFLGAFAVFYAAEQVASPISWLLAAAGVLTLAGFGYLVRRHRRLRSREARLEALAGLNEEALARLERRWGGLRPEREASGLRSHPYALDLDVVGPASLERLLSTVSTGPGARTLRSWLLEPAHREEVGARQEAVEELAEEIDFRQELAARTRLADLRREDSTASFLAWAEEESWFPGRTWLLWSARLVPPATLILFVLHMGGVVGRAWWALGVLAGLVFVGRWGSEAGDVLDRISSRQRSLGSYADVLAFLEDMEPSSDRLLRIREGVRAGEGSASQALRRLERWVAVADVRHNDLLHVPLQVLFFWDVHVLWILERWRRRNGSGVRSWLRALGDAEALAALSVLGTDHPDWTYPGVTDEPRLEADRLGHPLLTPAECVRNDVEVGPPGTFLLLTGSNMSGKSTLLRALGTNVVLARAGAPVCADRLRTGELMPVTSMRVEDSLSEGVSEFMAELRRTALVVDAARAAGDETQGDGAPVLYLLDEPLQGTNEAERRTALRIVLGHLLESWAVGAVATHDLLLHRTERLQEAACPVHFTSRVEEIDGEFELRFDYRLREGPATSTNALDLLRIVGLAEGEET